jgi:DNA-binding transcriptional regulator LsrR (DeoR family)
MVKLTDNKIEWVYSKVKAQSFVAARYGISRRRLQQLVKFYRETGAYA